jgi:AraC-like DNA-binding protein
MAGSSTALFSEPEAFEAAWQDAGGLRLYVTHAGRFRAKLTRVALGAVRLAAVHESQARVSVLAIPADTLLVTLPAGRSPAPIWGGIANRPGEIMTHGPAGRLLARTTGPCRWGAIWIPTSDLVRYADALVGKGMTVPPGSRIWRPRAAALRTLHTLHGAAIRTAENQPDALAQAQAAHGLLQQLAHALVECLSGERAAEEAPSLRRRRDIALRFEALLHRQPDGVHTQAGVSAALGVSRRDLGAACREQLGVGPAGFIRLHRMHQARLALRGGDSGGMGVAGIARRHGFHDSGRFARLYRELFGELPSATLRRWSRQSEGGIR